MYRQRRVCCLVLVLFVHPFQKNTKMLGSFAMNDAEITKSLLPEIVFFGVLRKEKHITHQTSRQQSPLPSSNADPWKRWQTHWVWANFSATNPLGHPK